MARSPKIGKLSIHNPRKDPLEVHVKVQDSANVTTVRLRVRKRGVVDDLETPLEATNIDSSPPGQVKVWFPYKKLRKIIRKYCKQPSGPRVASLPQGVIAPLVEGVDAGAGAAQDEVIYEDDNTTISVEVYSSPATIEQLTDAPINQEVVEWAWEAPEEPEP